MKTSRGERGRRTRAVLAAIRVRVGVVLIHSQSVSVGSTHAIPVFWATQYVTIDLLTFVSVFEMIWTPNDGGKQDFNFC